MKSESDAANYSLFRRWETQLNTPVHLKNLNVLEIGHGGGWYLAEALRAGCSFAYGVEISSELNERASIAMKSLGYKNFQLQTTDGKSFGSNTPFNLDFIYSITVFQHIPKPYTENYLKLIQQHLGGEGSAVLQFLESKDNSYQRISKFDVLSIAYSKADLLEMFEAAGLVPLKYGFVDYDSPSDRWGIYMLKRKKSA
jgi:2-polyprenyl-3-methyl-5-hydroxy-6-metoxy-1,4-benzoquinol methylase